MFFQIKIIKMVEILDIDTVRQQFEFQGSMILRDLTYLLEQTKKIERDLLTQIKMQELSISTYRPSVDSVKDQPPKKRIRI